MEELLAMYGEDFLKYTLASEVIPDPDALTDAQRETVRVLDTVSTAAQREPSGFGRNFVLPGIGRYHPASQTSIANALRIQCGGTLEEIDDDDKVTDRLLRLGRDAYPVLLIPKPENEQISFWHSLSIGTAIHSNPLSTEIHKAILEDAALVRLYPGAPPSDAIGSYAAATSIDADLSLSTGSGGTHQLVMLPQMILTGAYYRQILQGPLTPPTYLQAIREVLTDIRILANRRQVNTPMLVGPSNVRLADGLRVRLAKGVLRQATTQDQQLLELPDASTQITAVFETPYPLKVLRVSPWAPGPSEDSQKWIERWEKLQPQLNRYRQRSERVINHARYALLLASDADSPVGAVLVSSAILDPLEQGLRQSWRIDAGFRPVPEVTLGPDLAHRSEQWAKKVDKLHPSNLDMSMRRLLAAVSVRLDPMDGFVDAVIGWENMFGTGEGETTFRICGAMAHLLEPDDSKARLSHFRRLQALYRVRSSLVHGAQEPDPQSATTHRDEAVRYALMAMRLLYDHPPLLSAGTSSERGRNLLLGL